MPRRGTTWGSPYADGEPPTAADRGLLFMSWRTSLLDQFELLSRQWMDRRYGLEGGSGHHMLVGQAEVRECVIVAENGESQPLRAATHWVIPTGGYFFGPSLRTLLA
ncbi:MAG: hypothetical protein ACLGIF_07030 [Actinomycetes bacterium]